MSPRLSGWHQFPEGDVAVSGKVEDPPNRSQLVNATRLDLGQPYIENELDTAVIGQRRLLEGNGLYRSEEHTSELQSLRHLVCRLLLEKKKKKNQTCG